MQNWKNKLAAHLQRLLSQPDVSIYKVSAKAKQFGFKLSPTTVWDVANAKNKDVGIETIRALAKGFGIPERELFRHVTDLLDGEKSATKMAANLSLLNELFSLLGDIDKRRIEEALAILCEYADFRRRQRNAGNNDDLELFPNGEGVTFEIPMVGKANVNDRKEVRPASKKRKVR